MPLRPPAGFISAFYDPLKNPNAPTIGTATGGDASASVAFTAPSNVGGSAISSYTALSTPGGITASAASSPISVTGLTNGTAYTFAVWATNTYGPSAYSASSNSITPVAALGFFFGGNTGAAYVNTIQYVTLSTTGNSSDFGDISAAVGFKSAVGTPTRCVFGGVTSGTGLEYITPSSAGNSVTFGNLARNNSATGAIGNSIYGLFGPRNNGALYAFERITIASTGNASDFGNLITETYNYGGGVNNSTVGLVFGGYDSAVSGTRNYISQKTIASSGNSTDFGDLTLARQYAAGACSQTRGVMGGGTTPTSNIIDYVTISSAGNATDFGDLTLARGSTASASSNITAVWAGGNTGAGYVNIIDSVTIATTGNATDFGDLLEVIYGACGVGTAHGGVQ